MDSIYYSLSNEVEDDQQSKILKLEKEKELIKEELEKNSNTFAVCLAIKNGKIRQLESALANVTDFTANKSAKETKIETPSLRSLISTQLNIPLKDWTIHHCFAITPCHDLPLTRLGDSTRPVGIVIFRNTSTENLMFKIKAESREKFFVFPSCGRLLPGEMEIVIVIAHLKNEDLSNFIGEKIEFRAVQNESTNFDEFRKIWSETAQERRGKHDVFCLMAGNNNDQNISKKSATVDELNDRGIEEAASTSNECEQLKIRIREVEEELANGKAKSDDNASIIRILQEENDEGTRIIAEMKRKMENMQRTLERYGHFSG